MSVWERGIGGVQRDMVYLGKHVQNGEYHVGWRALSSSQAAEVVRALQITGAGQLSPLCELDE